MPFSNQTITYSESVSGWPSFYSFIPEQILGMNGRLYTFKNGKLFEHNSDVAPRNNYYGTQFNSTITSVFNEAPLENKIFKTIGIQSDDHWSAIVSSDIQTTGFITDSFFEQKEGAWYAYLRNNEANPVSGEFPLRSVQGIGIQSVRTGVGTNNCVITFPADVPLPSGIMPGSLTTTNGDVVFFTVAPFNTVMTPSSTGQVLSVDRANNQITLDNTAGTALPASGTDAYIFIVKNSIAESHGILGHYAEFKLTNSNTASVELFAVDSDIMKSFP
tara:strand:- start:226 stop:1047 length:822 start_codon:yes stop_codon:yes gene_type:complete